MLLSNKSFYTEKNMIENTKLMELLLKGLRIQKLYLIKDNKINLSKSGLPFLDKYLLAKE